MTGVLMSSAPPAVVGLTRAELDATVEAFFDAFRWTPPVPDPERMSAAEFLEAL